HHPDQEHVRRGNPKAVCAGGARQGAERAQRAVQARVPERADSDHHRLSSRIRGRVLRRIAAHRDAVFARRPGLSRLRIDRPARLPGRAGHAVLLHVARSRGQADRRPAVRRRRSARAVRGGGEMSDVMDVAVPDAERKAAVALPATSLSPNQRAWARFKRNRLGYGALLVFLAMLVLATFAELFSNERPLVAKYQGNWFFPIFNNQPETRFGGDFLTPTDWNDPFIHERFAR